MTARVTFFAWGDLHFGYQQRFAEQDFRWGIIQQMNRLAGWPYPEHVGGVVDMPAFSMLCGDLIDRPEHAETELALYQYFIKQLQIPSYETVGNHDIATPVLDWFMQKYGNTSYTFDMGGVHFISLHPHSAYSPSEKASFSSEDRDFLQADLKSVNDDTPVVLFTHAALNKSDNPQLVLDGLRGKRVILAIAAHHHVPAFYEYEGINCIDLGHCRSHPIDCEYGRSFCVVRIDGHSLTALPWRWDFQDWEQAQRWGRYGDEAMPEIARSRFLLDTTF